VADIAALDAAGVDRQQVARRGAEAVLKMVLEDGFFHADPHPGNVFVLPDGRIALIDYGMVGRLSSARRAQVLVLLHALVSHRAETVTEVLLDWTGEPDIDEAQLAEDIDAFVDRYHGVPLGQLDLVGMLLEVTTLLRVHRLALPADLAGGHRPQARSGFRHGTPRPAVPAPRDARPLFAEGAGTWRTAWPGGHG
jgi:ubiquinone biosynthesis protein